MLFDVKQAICAVAKEKNFREKLFVGTFLIMLANFLSTLNFRHVSAASSQSPLAQFNLFAGFAVLFAVFCYLLAYLNNKINDKEMPLWSDVYKYFVKGFKLLLSNILIGVPAFLFNGFWLYVFFYLNTTSPEAGKSLLGLGVQALIYLGWFAFVFVSILQTAIFAKRLKFRDFFNFVKGYYSLAGNFGAFLAFCAVVFCLMTLWVWVSMLAKNAGAYSYLLILLLSSPVFYIMTVYVDLLAQWVQKSYSTDDLE